MGGLISSPPLLQPYVPRRWSAVVAAASAKTQRPLQTHRPFKRDSQFQIGGLPIVLQGMPPASQAQLINAVTVGNGGDPLPERPRRRVLLKGLIGPCEGFLSGVFCTVIGRQQKTAQSENSGVVLLIENFESRTVCHVGARALVSNRCREIRLSCGVVTDFERAGFKND